MLVPVWFPGAALIKNGCLTFIKVHSRNHGSSTASTHVNDAQDGAPKSYQCVMLHYLGNFIEHLTTLHPKTQYIDDNR